MAVALGYRLVLERFGTCNAITMFDSVLAGRPRADQQAAAELLVRHLHAELLSNLRADIERHEGTAPSEPNLAQLVAQRPWLFGEHAYHIDTTHLASTVRIARMVELPEVLELAADLTEYGRRLDSQLQFAGEEPFGETYPGHGLFFGESLGRDVEPALEHFRVRAEQLPVNQVGTLPAEVYVVLLSRLGRHGEALEAAARLLPADRRTTGFAPTLLELAQRAGRYEPLLSACRQQDDLVGYATGLIARQRQAADAVRLDRRRLRSPGWTLRADPLHPIKKVCPGDGSRADLDRRTRSYQSFSVAMHDLAGGHDPTVTLDRGRGIGTRGRGHRGSVRSRGGSRSSSTATATASGSGSSAAAAGGSGIGTTAARFASRGTAASIRNRSSSCSSCGSGRCRADPCGSSGACGSHCCNRTREPTHNRSWEQPLRTREHKPEPQRSWLRKPVHRPERPHSWLRKPEHHSHSYCRNRSCSCSSCGSVVAAQRIVEVRVPG